MSDCSNEEKQSNYEDVLKQEAREAQEEAKLQKEKPLPSSSSAAASPPPSASSSPSHEFSFTISLHPSATILDKTKPPQFAVDLSPADEIFFHGHLLPLHLLSHLPVSPRSSTNSLDSFTLPIKELLEDQSPCHTDSIDNSNDLQDDDYYCQSNEFDQRKERAKSKSFSLFGLPKWKKGSELREKEEKDRRNKRKLSFDVRHAIKRYMGMVRPLLSFRSRRRNVQFQRQAYSFSGSLSSRIKQEMNRGRRGEFSAPASMRTSPTNSGLLVATETFPHSYTSDSTMEELQAAIQAAIAHCKNSIANEEKIAIIN